MLNRWNFLKPGFYEGIKHEFNLTPFLQATNIIPNNKGDYIFLGQSIGLETVHQDFCHYVLADKLMHEDQASVCSKCHLMLDSLVKTRFEEVPAI